MTTRKIYEFDKEHHGDEFIIVSNSDGTITMKVKLQQGVNEYRSILFTGESMTQIERILPPILKVIKNG